MRPEFFFYVENINGDIPYLCNFTNRTIEQTLKNFEIYSPWKRGKTHLLLIRKKSPTFAKKHFTDQIAFLAINNFLKKEKILKIFNHKKNCLKLPKLGEFSFFKTRLITENDVWLTGI
jgi:hypothetical protein